MIGIGGATLLIAGLVLLVAGGAQIAVALGLVGVLAAYLATGDWHAVTALLAATAYDGLRQPLLLLIPLLLLMGEFFARSGALTALFRMLNRDLRAAPAGSALAAMLGQALYAFAAGASASSAAGFTRVAYPALKAAGWDRATALGLLASSSAFGALIPPSVMLAAWGLLTHQSIGPLFLAAVVPAILIAALFAVVILSSKSTASSGTAAKASTGFTAHGIESAVGIALVLIVILGGIGTRLLTPLEAASVGTVIGLLMALRQGMRLAAIVEAILAVGRASAPILLLIFAAQIFSQALALIGVGDALSNAIASLGVGLGLATMVAIWLILSTVLDQLSIMAVTLAVFAPAAAKIGIAAPAFAVLGVIALEAAQLIPPFGLLVFTAKAAVEDDGVALPDIFRRVLPFLAILIGMLLCLAAFPAIAMWLPRLAF